MSRQDASYSKAFIMRPYTGFETQYQAENARTLLMWSENGQPLDQRAGDTGYSPNLVRGLPVPFGARVAIWLPYIQFTNAVDASSPAFTLIPQGFYGWRIGWRLRTLRDYRLNRKPFHYPKTSAGVPDSGAARSIVPVAWETAVADQAIYTPPNSVLGVTARSMSVAQTFLRREDALTGAAHIYDAPLLPASSPTRGELSQGVLPTDSPAFPTSDGNKAYRPMWLVYETKARGDELLLGCYKDTTGGTADGAWDFQTGGVDAPLSAIFGSDVGEIFEETTGPFPFLGAFVLYGSDAT